MIVYVVSNISEKENTHIAPHFVYTYIRECVMYCLTHIGILAIMCVRAHITGETYGYLTTMMAVFRTLLYNCSIH